MNNEKSSFVMVVVRMKNESSSASSASFFENSVPMLMPNLNVLVRHSEREW